MVVRMEGFAFSLASLCDGGHDSAALLGGLAGPTAFAADLTAFAAECCKVLAHSWCHANIFLSCHINTIAAFVVKCNRIRLQRKRLSSILVLELPVRSGINQ